MRHRRRAVPPAERAATSAVICERLIEKFFVQNASSSILYSSSVYLSSPDEIDLADFIRTCATRRIRLAAPRWNGTAYELAELNDCWPNGLASGPHGIPEPPSSAPRVDVSEIGVWIVPGLAFAKDGSRLGYGGGWYDRLLANANPAANKIGVCHRFQLLDELPNEPHDIRLDEVVTN